MHWGETMGSLGRANRLSAQDVDPHSGQPGFKDTPARIASFEPDWRAFETPTARILEVTRNQRKLRRGAIAGNRFHITVRDLGPNREALAERLSHVAANGVPNYFGPQRFGHDGANVGAAAQMFEDGDLRRMPRHRRSLYLSAARAYLFNRILAERVAGGTWNRAIPGDVFMFSSGHSLFRGDAASPDIVERIERGEIHPAGTLWGIGERLTSEQALAAEDRALAEGLALMQGLEQAEVRSAMRALRVRPIDLEWQFDEDQSLTLRFILPSGAYATSVLRELVDTGSASLPEPDDSDEGRPER
jgi:tRNA pseudouridine13 synthase